MEQAPVVGCDVEEMDAPGRGFGCDDEGAAVEEEVEIFAEADTVSGIGGGVSCEEDLVEVVGLHFVDCELDR